MCNKHKKSSTCEHTHFHDSFGRRSSGITAHIQSCIFVMVRGHSHLLARHVEASLSLLMNRIASGRDLSSEISSSWRISVIQYFENVVPLSRNIIWGNSTSDGSDLLDCLLEYTEIANIRRLNHSGCSSWNCQHL